MIADVGPEANAARTGFGTCGEKQKEEGYGEGSWCRRRYGVVSVLMDRGYETGRMPVGHIRRKGQIGFRTPTLHGVALQTVGFSGGRLRADHQEVAYGNDEVEGAPSTSSNYQAVSCHGFSSRQSGSTNGFYPDLSEHHASTPRHVRNTQWGQSEDTGRTMA